MEFAHSQEINLQRPIIMHIERDRLDNRLSVGDADDNRQ